MLKGLERMRYIAQVQSLIKKHFNLHEDKDEACCALDESIQALLDKTTQDSYESLVKTLQGQAMNFFETALIAGNMLNNN